MNPIAELLRQLGPVRVAALAATGIAVLGFFIFLSSRLSSGGMALLYGDLDPQDSGQIIQTLQSKNIPYDIKAGGKQIFVPGDQVLQLRVSLAESGLPGGGSVGYEIFDNTPFVRTLAFHLGIGKLLYIALRNRTQFKIYRPLYPIVPR